MAEHAFNWDLLPLAISKRDVLDSFLVLVCPFVKRILDIAQMMFLWFSPRQHAH